MSQQFIRGPVCGIDNCPSRLYRSVDGLKMCQYGHVLEGEIEINDENEGGLGDGVMTRRLGINVNELSGKFEAKEVRQQGKRIRESKRLSGNQGREILLRALQLTLKLQLKCLIKELFPQDESFIKELQMVVKTNWIRVLDNFVGKDNKNNHHSFILKPTTRLPNVMDLVFILYYSVLKLNYYPIYVSDIVRLVRLNRIPVFNTINLLPKHIQEKLPTRSSRTLQIFRFTEGYFYRRLLRFSRKATLLTVSLKSVNYYYPFILKQFQEVLLLPNSIELFMLTTKLISKLEYKFNYNVFFDPELKKKLEGVHETRKCNPDIVLVCFIIIVVKIHFIYNEDNKIDYKAWLNNMSKLQFNDDDLSIFDSNPSHELIYDLVNWSDEKINNYCNHLNNIFVQSTTTTSPTTLNGERINDENGTSTQVPHIMQLGEDKSNQTGVMLSRLLQIFNYESIQRNSSSTNTSFEVSDINIDEYLSSYNEEKIKKITYKDIFIIEDQLFEKYSVMFNINKMSFYTHYMHVESLIQQHLKKHPIDEDMEDRV